MTSSKGQSNRSNDDLEYLSFFDLAEEPFSTTANPRYFHLTPTHKLALNKTRFAIQGGKGLTIVYGSSGTGKSSLARILREMFIAKDFKTALLVNPELPTQFALLKKIASEFGIPPAYSYLAMLERLKSSLVEEYTDQQMPYVLIIDEAHRLSARSLELLRQLMNYETNEVKLIQIALIGEDPLRATLRRRRNASFRNRVAMASELSPLTPSEVVEMIDHRWRTASGNKKHPFTKEALAYLAEASSGIPREITVLADNALLAARLQDLQSIDLELMELVVKDREKHLGKLDNSNNS